MAKTKYTGYELSRTWFDFCFENPEKIRPIHTALYFFAIEHCNRLGWKEKFGLPTEMSKDALGVKSWHTYIKAFNDLIDWGFFILIERSKNQYSSNIIALSKYNEALDEALDNAITKHVSKQQRSTYQSNDSIDKPITNNEQTKKAAPAFSVSEFKEMFDVFRKKHGGKGKRSLDVEFEHFKKKHKDWREIIPTLPDIIDKHIEYRKRLESAGEFVANWKNFSTWVNNRCWTEELEPIEGKTTSNGQLPIDFVVTEPYFLQGTGGVETMIHKETRLTITGKIHTEMKEGVLRFVDEQGREITEEEYNEKKQLQTH